MVRPNSWSLLEAGKFLNSILMLLLFLILIGLGLVRLSENDRGLSSELLANRVQGAFSPHDDERVAVREDLRFA